MIIKRDQNKYVNKIFRMKNPALANHVVVFSRFLKVPVIDQSHDVPIG